MEYLLAQSGQGDLKAAQDDEIGKTLPAPLMEEAQLEDILDPTVCEAGDVNMEMPTAMRIPDAAPSRDSRSPSPMSLSPPVPSTSAMESPSPPLPADSPSLVEVSITGLTKCDISGEHMRQMKLCISELHSDNS